MLAAVTSLLGSFLLGVPFFNKEACHNFHSKLEYIMIRVIWLQLNNITDVFSQPLQITSNSLLLFSIYFTSKQEGGQIFQFTLLLEIFSAENNFLSFT